MSLFLYCFCHLVFALQLSCVLRHSFYLPLDWLWILKLIWEWKYAELWNFFSMHFTQTWSFCSESRREVCLCKITFALRKVWWQLVGRRYAYNIIIVCAELTSAPLSVIINRDHKLITMEIWEHYRILHSVTHHILGWPQNNLFMKIFKVSKYLWGFV